MQVDASVLTPPQLAEHDDVATQFDQEGRDAVCVVILLVEEHDEELQIAILVRVDEPFPPMYRQYF